MSNGSLHGKASIVTGGASGIGKAIVGRLVESGAAVVIADVDRESGNRTREQLGQYGHVFVQPCDAADETEVQAAVAAARKRMGRIDFLVNNCGISCGGPIENLSLEDWNRVLAVNLTSAFLFTKHAVGHLRENRGAIVNIASTRALMSESGTEAYSASKGGLVALTHATAVSLGPDVRVNCVSPGWIHTGPWRQAPVEPDAELTETDHDQHPAGRVGRAEDVAAMVIALLSDAGEFVTGQNIVVDGGMTKKMIYR